MTTDTTEPSQCWTTTTELASCPQPPSATLSKKMSIEDILARGLSVSERAFSTEAPCQQQLTISFFFDGTGNNKDIDTPLKKTSNVSRLSDAHEFTTAQNIIPVYIPGVGTPFPQIGDKGGYMGMAFGVGGEERIQYAMKQFDDYLTKAEARTMKTFNSSIRFWQRVPLVTLLAITQGSCENRPDAVALSLTGYNYTGRYISSYSVEGYGGGGLMEEADGGGVVCCLSFRPDSKIPFTVKVQWTFGREEDDKGNITRQPEIHSAIVQVGPIIPNTLGLPHEPDLFETHFLPDGTVKAYVTETNSDPYYTPDGIPLRPMP